jgi:hypothetical protein
MPSSITFRGTRLYEPSVVVDVVNTLDTSGQLGAKNLCVVGEFPILKKDTPYKFGQGGFDLTEVYPMDAKLLTLDKIWRRSLAVADGISKSITYVSAAQSTQAQWVLQDATATDALTLKSTYYGTSGNDIRLQLDDPSSLPAELSASGPYYKLSLRAPWQDTDAEYVIDGGDQLQLTLADGDQLEITTSKTMVYTPSGQAAQTFILSDYSRMDELVAVLPAALAGIALSFSVPSKLDVLDYTSVGQNTIALHAHTAELIDTIESFSSLPFDVELADGYRLLPDFVYTGPSTAAVNGGAPTDAQYSAAFASVENKDITTITVFSTDQDHHDLLKGHLDLAYIAGRERNAWVGAPSQTSLADIYSGYVLKMNDFRISVVGQDITFADHKGARRDEGPEYLAFMLMCAQGALPPAEPLTRKALNIFDTKENWDRERASNSVAQKSIVAVKLGSSNELEVIRSLTSWRKDDLSVNTEVSCRESIDVCVRELRKFLTSELGSRITNSTGNRVSALAKQRLTQLRDLGAIQDFRNIQLRREADTIFIDFDVALIEPLNFIRITANIVAGQ